jgi:glycosyltransferase involved in cell wall biosynthesis
MKKPIPPRILFITSVSLTPDRKNLNSFQRIKYLSQESQLSIIGRFDTQLCSRTPKNSCFISKLPGKLGIIIWSTIHILFNRECSRSDLVITEPSLLCLVGFIGKLLKRKRMWVVDVWDIPFRNSKSSRISDVWTFCMKHIFRILFKYADLFIVSIVPDFEFRFFKISPRKTLLLNNAIVMDNRKKEDQLPKISNSFNILCSRSVFYEDMGLDVLAEACSILSKNITNVTITIIGDTNKSSKRQLVWFRKKKDVIILNKIPHCELLKYVMNADVCVVPFKNTPDLAQTYPVKILEYLSMGKPVIASRIAGISSIIQDGYNGLLFEPGNAQDLAYKIQLLYKDQYLRDEISRKAKVLDQKYNSITKNRFILERIRLLLKNNDHVS